MVDKKLGGAGLRGQVAGETALCTVGKSGTGLTYRGFDISVLAENASFEEVAFLLLRGYLPNEGELEEYLTTIIQNRWLPEALKDVLERLPASAHPMDVMRTGCSVLGNLETETDFGQQEGAIDRYLQFFPQSSVIGTVFLITGSESRLSWTTRRSARIFYTCCPASDLQTCSVR